MTATASPETVAVLAPGGRDSAVACGILTTAGLDSRACTSLGALVDALSTETIGIAVIADEALIRADLRALGDWVSQQPAWSDAPFIVLTRQGGFERHATQQRLVDALANVTFLERPFHPTTLVSMVHTALRTRRRQYEARDTLVVVRDAQQNLELALAAGRLGAWELTVPHNVLTASEHCKRSFGRHAQERFDYPDLVAAIHPDDREHHQHACVRAIDQRDGLELTHRVLWPDGSLHWVEITGRVRLNDAGAVVALVGVSADITLRVEAEQERNRLVTALSAERSVLEERVEQRTAELVEANRALTAEMEAKSTAELQLRQAQKVETIGQLVGGVAHDFNNLLMVVMSNLDLLRRRLKSDPANLRLVEVAKRGAQRGAELTQRLLAYARKQDLQPEPVHVDELVAGLAGLLGRSLGPLIDIRVTQASELPPVLVDPNQLEMAVLNLAVNARDAMDGTGTLSITLGVVNARPGNEQRLPEGDYVELAVRDTGKGMDAPTLARAIEPFFSTKGVGKGTGLGLSMVHGLARQSGGAFVLSSEVGVGTTAALWLPVTSAAAVERPKADDTPDVPGVGHVLVVDDDELVAMGTAAMLDDLGYQVTVAHSGPAALAILDGGLVPNVMITDHAMPGMTGAELAREVRRLKPELPILVATGYADLFGDEVFDVPKLSKPYSQEQLAHELARFTTLARAG